jgi:hypothetical protein
MDPDAPWQGSQNAAARKAVETTDAAWPTMVRRSLMAEEAKSFRSYCLARKRSEKAKGRAGASPRAPATPSRPSRDDQRRPHEGKPIPNSKRDGSYLRLRCRCCKGALRGTAAQMAKRASSPLFADNLD